jgi:hypothetical protein
LALIPVGPYSSSANNGLALIPLALSPVGLYSGFAKNGLALIPLALSPVGLYSGFAENGLALIPVALFPVALSPVGPYSGWPLVRFTIFTALALILMALSPPPLLMFVFRDYFTWFYCTRVGREIDKNCSDFFTTPPR